RQAPPAPGRDREHSRRDARRRCVVGGLRRRRLRRGRRRRAARRRLRVSLALTRMPPVAPLLEKPCKYRLFVKASSHFWTPLKGTRPRAITGETGSKEQPGDKPQTTNTMEV